MRCLALVALLGLAACDDGRRFDDPMISNGNQLDPIDCRDASPHMGKNEVCTVGENTYINRADDNRQQELPDNLAVLK